MRKKTLTNQFLLLVCFILTVTEIQAQDSVVKESVVNMKYYSVNNKIPYLIIKTQYKLGKKYTPVKNIPVQVYIDSDSSEANLLGKAITSDNGEAKLIIPASVKAIWDASSLHNFIASSTATKEFEVTKTELPVTKSKIEIDTSSDGETRSITVTVTELKNGVWAPAKDVELKIGISRLNSLLPAGDEETYTTDSSGQATAEFKKDSMPGDIKGNLILVTKVEDNEFYGNLSMEKVVPWGVYKITENNFNKRTLWGTRDKTPVWLLIMAYSIAGGVWSVFIYLIFQLLKIKKLGKASV